MNGYAKGNYFCTCHKCKSQFIGDKRAVTCASCAIEPALKRIKEMEKELSDWKEASKLQDDGLRAAKQRIEELRNENEESEKLLLDCIPAIKHLTGEVSLNNRLESWYHKKRIEWENKLLEQKDDA